MFTYLINSIVLDLLTNKPIIIAENESFPKADSKSRMTGGKLRKKTKSGLDNIPRKHKVKKLKTKTEMRIFENTPQKLKRRNQHRRRKLLKYYRRLSKP